MVDNVSKSGNNFSEVTFNYSGNDGKEHTKKLKVEHGVVIDFYNKAGYYENSYTVNNKGQVVANYTNKGNNKVVDQIEATEEQINQIMRIQSNSKDAGLSKKDYQIENEKKEKQKMQELTNNGTVPFKTKHPILAKILPEWAQKILK